MPELDRVEMIWFRDWYDGPLDGLARLDGREYWFNATGDWVNDRPRRYVLIHAPENDLERERQAHAAGQPFESNFVADAEGLFDDCPVLGTFVLE